MSATPDSMFTTAEQLIADLQRQLAECRAEHDEALQRETATAEVFQVINSSPGDGNMCGIAMRDAVAPPGSKATSRPKGTRRNLRDLMSGHRLQSRLVRIGKVRNRSR